MADKLIYISNHDTQSFAAFNLKRLDTQINEQTIVNLLRVSKVVRPTNQNKTLGTIVINSPLSPPSPLVVQSKYKTKSAMEGGKNLFIIS